MLVIDISDYASCGRLCEVHVYASDALERPNELIDAVKIGQSVAIVVERGGARVMLSTTPEARK